MNNKTNKINKTNKANPDSSSLQIIMADVLEEGQKKDIYSILKAVDTEFVPPLSARSSTRQNSFEQSVPEEKNEPEVYYESMIEQHFVLALTEGKVIGFLSYIPQHSVRYPMRNEQVTADYISTIAVLPEYRGQGITRRMYELFLKNSQAKNVVTRTWSLNHAHLHILAAMKFTLAETIPDDRGPGIDTVYYQKTR